MKYEKNIMRYFCHCTILLVFILICRAQNNYEEYKDKTIKHVIQKLGNVTLDTFSNLLPEEKAKLLSKIENKLKKTTNSLGPEGQKYVKFIMHGVKLMSYNNSNIDNIDISPLINYTKLVEKSDFRPKNEINKTQSNKGESKEEVIEKIIHKIEFLSKILLKDAKTPQDKQKVMENIKRRVMESARKKHLGVHNKHDKVKSYSNHIVKSIDLASRRNFLNKTSRVNLKFVDNINLTKDNDENIKFINTKGIQIPNKTNLDNNPVNTDYTDSNKLELRCDIIINITCLNIRSLNKLPCQFSHDEKEVELKKLCDGVADCFNAADEEDCPTRAIEKVRSAGQVMAEVESALSRKCFSHLDDNSILTKQNKVLINVLKSQLYFIQKHSNMTYSPNFRSRRVDFVDALTLKKTVNEVAVVVSTLALALEGSLCSHEFNKFKGNDARKYSNVVDKHSDALKYISPLSLKWCTCDSQFCTSKICSNECKSVCLQKYNLHRWSCEAVNGGKSVSLDVICDGKLDCYDETDENGCAPGTGLAKFEASVMFNNILNLLVTKSTSKEYEVARGKLVSLHSSITLLEKLSKNKGTDMLTIKSLRDQCFTDLTSVYEAIVSNEPSMDVINDVYLFLLSLNVKMVSALKRSHSGNDKIISSDGCFCREARCAQPTCSKMCVRACAAEPILKRYFCGRDPIYNISVPIENVCNGKLNCPNRNDEEDCKKEICRKHHLILLRHSIKDAGERHRGTALGEALKSWKTKVTATLMIAEKNARPTPKAMKYIVRDILQDLVMTYATLDDFRRSNNDYILKEFSQLSQNVIEILKYCGQ